MKFTCFVGWFLPENLNTALFVFFNEELEMISYETVPSTELLIIFCC